MNRSGHTQPKSTGFLDRLLGRSDVFFHGSKYMNRWRFIHRKHFGIRVHQIVRDDDDRALHDHPFDFVSVILRGGYIEQTADGKKTKYKPGQILFRSASALHRLDLNRNERGEVIPAWTLVFRGPVLRRWGFLHVPEGAWEDADDSFNNKQAKEYREANGQATPSVLNRVVPRS